MAAHSAPRVSLNGTSYWTCDITAAWGLPWGGGSGCANAVGHDRIGCFSIPTELNALLQASTNTSNITQHPTGVCMCGRMRGMFSANHPFAPDCYEAACVTGVDACSTLSVLAPLSLMISGINMLITLYTLCFLVYTQVTLAWGGRLRFNAVGTSLISGTMATLALLTVQSNNIVEAALAQEKLPTFWFFSHVIKPITMPLAAFFSFVCNMSVGLVWVQIASQMKSLTDTVPSRARRKALAFVVTCACVYGVALAVINIKGKPAQALTLSICFALLVATTFLCAGTKLSCVMSHFDNDDETGSNDNKEGGGSNTHNMRGGKTKTSSQSEGSSTGAGDDSSCNSSFMSNLSSSEEEGLSDSNPSPSPSSLKRRGSKTRAQLLRTSSSIITVMGGKQGNHDDRVWRIIIASRKIAIVMMSFVVGLVATAVLFIARQHGLAHASLFLVAYHIVVQNSPTLAVLITANFIARSTATVRRGRCCGYGKCARIRGSGRGSMSGRQGGTGFNSGLGRRTDRKDRHHTRKSLRSSRPASTGKVEKVRKRAVAGRGTCNDDASKEVHSSCPAIDERGGPEGEEEAHVMACVTPLPEIALDEDDVSIVVG